MKETFFFRNRRRDRLHLLTALGLLLAITMTGSMVAGVALAEPPDYDVLDEILGRNIRNGFVDYDGLALEPRLDEFIDQIATARRVDLPSADAELAFYINAYNILAIQGILNGLSPSSWWGRKKFFKREKYEVLGERISLEVLEHERIIVLGEQRVHFAIVCASMSCPRLSSRAYRPETLDVQLHEAAQRFINDPVRNRFDTGRGIALLSKIFDWYADDFIAAGGSIQRYLARFISDAEVQDALRRDEIDIRFTKYDWNLNGHFGGQD